MDDSIYEFGLDDAKIIKSQAIDLFKLSKSGEKARISIVSFKKHYDLVVADKTRKKGAPLTEIEKAEILTKVDAKLAELLHKKPEDLTETDRLDRKSLKFWYAFTHYRDGIGSIRCLSKFENNNVIKSDVCCDKFGDPDQTVAAIVMQYPTDENQQVDEALFKQRKYVNFNVLRMSSKKFRRIESAYAGAHEDNKYVVDLRVSLEGDPKYQKLSFEVQASAYWARDTIDPEIQKWVLEHGLRAHKHVSSFLGFQLTREKLLERLAGASGESIEDRPQISNVSYNSLIE
jgi:hypothetical protein